MTWTDIDGWSAPYPAALLEALRTLPGSDQLPFDRLDGMARIIASVENGGRDEELSRARPASAAATETELRRLHDLCERLADHVEAMHRPAVSALYREGLALFDLVPRLRETADMAKIAYGAHEAPERAPGRRPAVIAPDVTDMAATVFEQITGEPPTYSSDPDTSRVTGAWPEFLSKVFAALYIDASAASQVKTLAKNAPKNS